MTDYTELIKRNGKSPLLWVLHKELKRGIIIRNRITGELFILDTV